MLIQETAEVITVGSGTGITGGCEPPDTAAGSLTQDLWGTVNNRLLNHLSGPEV